MWVHISSLIDENTPPASRAFAVYVQKGNNRVCVCGVELWNGNFFAKPKFVSGIIACKCMVLLIL